MRYAILAELLVTVAAAPPQAPVPPQAPPVLVVTPKQAPCVCGDRCDCEAKGRTCPGQCPVVPPGFGPAPPGLEWWRDPRGPGGWGLRQVGTVTVPEATRNVAPRLLTVQPQQNCPGGKCPNVASGVIVRPTNPLGR